VKNQEISADYYGMYCSELANRLNAAEQDPPFVAMMANGTSGDINNINFRQPRPSSPPYVQMRRVAEDVAAKVTGAVANLQWKDRAELDARYRELELSWRPIEPELVAWAKEKQSSPPEKVSKSDLPYIYAGRVLKLAEAKNPALIPLQVLRIGDICLGTFPCETFAEIGLEFKKRSSMPNSFMVELAHVRVTSNLAVMRPGRGRTRSSDRPP
jgi:neutral ceramidase